MKDNFCRIIFFFRYVLFARHRRGHRIHSPFLFAFVKEVLNNRAKITDYDIIESFFFKKASLNLPPIEVRDLGSSSKTFYRSKRPFSKLLKRSSVSKKYGRLLYRIIKYFKPENILELGSSIGVSTIYMSRGNMSSVINSVEGNASLIELARECAKEVSCNNINYHQMLFHDYLVSNLHHNTKYQLVFIDGDHQYESTLRYFNMLVGHVPDGLIIIDDINWSCAMIKAWQKICNHPDSQLTINLYQFGLVFTGKHLTPGHFMIRY